MRPCWISQPSGMRSPSLSQLNGLVPLMNSRALVRASWSGSPLASFTSQSRPLVKTYFCWVLSYDQLPVAASCQSFMPSPSRSLALSAVPLVLAFFGLKPRRYSYWFSMPSESGSSYASYQFKGSRPLASSHVSSMPSPSLSSTRATTSKLKTDLTCPRLAGE